MRRRKFKYSKLHYFFVSYIHSFELIILLLVNFILEKSSTYFTNVHKWARLIPVLGRMGPVGHWSDSHALNHCYEAITIEKKNIFFL